MSNSQTIKEKVDSYSIARIKKRKEFILSKSFNDLSWDGKREYLVYESNNTCSRCKLDSWQGSPMPIEVNHIDGNNTNHERNNLECLCPNCHALTSNWRGRNKTINGKTSNEKLLEILLINDWNMRKSLIQAGLTPKGGNYKRCHQIQKEYIEFGKVITEVRAGIDITREEYIIFFNSTNTNIELSKKLGVGLKTIVKLGKLFKCQRNRAENIPSMEELLKSVEKCKFFAEVGRMYYVSDNTIRHWCKKYEILDQVTDIFKKNKFASMYLT